MVCRGLFLVAVKIHERGKDIFRGMSIEADGADETLVSELSIFQQSEIVGRHDSLHLFPVVIHFRDLIAFP